LQKPFLSGFSSLLRCGKDLRQLPEILGGSGAEKFVVCATWATQSKPAEDKDAFEVRQEHLDLLPKPDLDLSPQLPSPCT
jgi:hypothetical protein